MQSDQAVYCWLTQLHIFNMTIITKTVSKTKFWQVHLWNQEVKGYVMFLYIYIYIYLKLMLKIKRKQYSIWPGKIGWSGSTLTEQGKSMAISIAKIHLVTFTFVPGHLSYLREHHAVRVERMTKQFSISFEQRTNLHYIYANFNKRKHF